jgi:hypothetical protein
LAAVTEAGAEPTVTLHSEDADALWEAWVAPGEDDILARAAFERLLRATAGLVLSTMASSPGAS